MKEERCRLQGIGSNAEEDGSRAERGGTGEKRTAGRTGSFLAHFGSYWTVIRFCGKELLR